MAKMIGATVLSDFGMKTRVSRINCISTMLSLYGNISSDILFFYGIYLIAFIGKRRRFHAVKKMAERSGNGNLKMLLLRLTGMELPIRTLFWLGMVFGKLLEYLIEFALQILFPCRCREMTVDL